MNNRWDKAKVKVVWQTKYSMQAYNSSGRTIADNSTTAGWRHSVLECRDQFLDKYLIVKGKISWLHFHVLKPYSKTNENVLLFS